MHFSSLSILQNHTTTLGSIFPWRECFVVGGAIRDLLLGITDNPNDIDITWAWQPNDRRDMMELPEEDRSCFRTEKFGTMTLVDKATDPHCFYEITPFREETGYADNRHPDQITRSNNLLADSCRRDFTINSLYWTPITTMDAKNCFTTTEISLKDDQQLLTILKQHGWCVLIDSRTIILQSHELITHFQENGIIPELPICTCTDRACPVPAPTNSFSLLLDPHHWLNDIINRKIRAVGIPEDRFTEDALRILRWIRFTNILNQSIPNAEKQNSGFDLDKPTRQGMEKTVHLIKELSAERLHAELIKVFSGNNPFGYVALLRELGLLEIIFPALAGTVNNRQPVRYHPFDTYNHTLLTLWHCQQLCNDPLVKCAMLYHDVGKPEQYAFMDAAIAANPENPDRTWYIAHPEISVRLAKEDFSALAFSKAEIDQISRYIKYHHRPWEILDSKTNTWTRKLRELMSEWGYDATLNLLTIAIADRLGQYNPLQKAAISELEHLKTMVTELYDTEWQFTMKQLAINGNDIMKTFGIAPWPQLWELLKKAFDRVLTDVPVRNTKEEIYGYLKTFVR